MDEQCVEEGGSVTEATAESESWRMHAMLDAPGGETLDFLIADLASADTKSLLALDLCHDSTQEAQDMTLPCETADTPIDPALSHYPSLFMDCILPPPFYLPKTLYRPMRDIAPTMNRMFSGWTASPSKRRRRRKKKKRLSVTSRQSNCWSTRLRSGQSADCWMKRLRSRRHTSHLNVAPLVKRHPNNHGNASGSKGLRKRIIKESLRYTRKEVVISGEETTPDEENASVGHILQLYDSSLEFCHQCRSKTKRAKMYCNNEISPKKSCVLKYCALCLTKRYPYRSFDYNSRTFKCPRCEDYCNCTACASKRGEKYVSTKDFDWNTRPQDGQGEDPQSYETEERASDDDEQASMRYSCQSSCSAESVGSGEKIQLRYHTCHQCKTRHHPTMKCSQTKENGKLCPLRYCKICLKLRYPRIVFVEDAEFTCPRCSETCNCKLCMTRRGEIYISRRRTRRGGEETTTRFSLEGSPPQSETTVVAYEGNGSPSAAAQPRHAINDSLPARSSSPSVLLEPSKDALGRNISIDDNDKIPFVLLPRISSIRAGKEASNRSRSGRLVKLSAKAREGGNHAHARYQ